MKHDEHDELWDLLGKAREPKDRPFFASKVLRAIRAEAQEPKRVTFWQWLRRSWVLPTVATATAVLAVVVALQDSPVTVSPPLTSSVTGNSEGSNGSGSNGATYVQAKADPLRGLAEAMSAMSAGDDDLSTPLPELLATEDHSVWLQDDPSSLY